jgi:hypothetical protein
MTSTSYVKVLMHTQAQNLLLRANILGKDNTNTLGLHTYMHAI